MPRKSISEQPMTNAERQARWRAARASGTPAVQLGGHLITVVAPSAERDAISELTTLQGDYAAGWKPCLKTLQEQRHRRGVAGDLRPRPD